jgi:hypothetical protein
VQGRKAAAAAPTGPHARAPRRTSLEKGYEGGLPAMPRRSPGRDCQVGPGKASKSEGFIPVVLRKEVIQPQVPLRLPCYDFTPVAEPTVAGCPLAVSAPSSGRPNSHGVTGGVYKARERIHRVMLLRDY